MHASSRALSTDQKQRRRDTILAAAQVRFADSCYDAILMDAIAGDVGLAKGTLYLYFHSKEELFLALHQQQLGLWFDELDSYLENNQGTASFDNLVRFMGESLRRRPACLRLMAILHTVLEQNVAYAAAHRFKASLKQRMFKTGALIEKHLPFLSPGQGSALLMQINALVIGFQHMAEPSGVMRQVLAEDDMALFRVDLETSLLNSLRTLLMGLAYEAKYRRE